MNRMTQGCPICNHTAATPVIARLSYLYVRCPDCDSIYVDPMPPQEEIAAYYQNPAYFAGEEGGYRNYVDMHKALAPHFHRRLRILAQALPQRGRLLDFGCADGFFLELARAEGWQVAGVELAQGMAEQATRRLGVPIVTSLDALPPESFDAIALWEVIEHLSRPVEDLRRLRQRLRRGGILALSTPNAGHWQAVRAPESWDSYRPPAHLVLFTAGSLLRALRQAGFEQVTIHRVAPLPPLPGWLGRITISLERHLADGTARPWIVMRALWRAIRLLGWAWQKMAHRQEDIFATLEAIARCP